MLHGKPEQQQPADDREGLSHDQRVEFGGSRQKLLDIVEARSYDGCCMCSGVGHVTLMPTPTLEQRTLEAAQLAEKFYIQKFQSLIKNHQNAKNLIEDKKTALGKRVQ